MPLLRLWHLRHLWCVAALMPLAGAAAQAADSTVYSFDLDVPAGHYSFWRLHDIGRAVRLEATLEITAMRSHAQYGPAFMFALADGEQSVVMQIQSPSGRPPLRMFLRRLSGEKTQQQVPFKLSIPLAKTFQVTLDWSTGNLVATVDGERQSLPRGFTVRSLNVTSSTGDLIAHRLVLHDTGGSR